MNLGFDPIYNNEQNSELWITGLNDPDSLPNVQLQIFAHLMTRLMAVYDTVVEHHDLGAVGDIRFTNWSNMIRGFVDSPGGQWWLAQSDFHYEFSPSARNSLKLAD